MKHYATLRVKGSEEVIEVYDKANPNAHNRIEGSKSHYQGRIDLVTEDGREVTPIGDNSYKILDMTGDNDIELERL